MRKRMSPMGASSFVVFGGWFGSVGLVVRVWGGFSESGFMVRVWGCGFMEPGRRIWSACGQSTGQERRRGVGQECRWGIGQGVDDSPGGTNRGEEGRSVRRCGRAVGCPGGVFWTGTVERQSGGWGNGRFGMRLESTERCRGDGVRSGRHGPRAADVKRPVRDVPVRRNDDDNGPRARKTAAYGINSENLYYLCLLCP